MLICPKCGKTDDAVKFIESFCVDCYPVNVKVPEKKITVQICKHCNKMFLKGEWMRHSDKKIREQVVSKCRGDFKSAEYDLENGIVNFIIEKRGSEIKVGRKYAIESVTVTCPTCSRVSGGYFEAIVQLRGKDEKVEKNRKLFEGRLSKRTFITKETPQKGGIDLYVGNSKAVLELVRELGLNAKITTKLVGVKEGGRKAYRTSFAIRL
ncbi:MAG: NMD3-related protein [Candidatus Micrarchaeota archaeon]